MVVPVLQGQEQKIEPLRVSVGNRPQMPKAKEDGLPRSPNTALRELSQAARSSKASYTAWADMSTHSCTHTQW